MTTNPLLLHEFDPLPLLRAATGIHKPSGQTPREIGQQEHPMKGFPIDSLLSEMLLISALLYGKLTDQKSGMCPLCSSGTSNLPRVHPPN